MRDTDRFRIDEPRVIGEVMEGELVLVHFESGRYYSVRGIGADICQLLSAGMTIGDAWRRLSSHFQIPEAQVEKDVREFVDELVRENVLVTATSNVLANAQLSIAASRYERATFEKFDDMADQLLLDPIHEIDESGWPMRKSA